MSGASGLVAVMPVKDFENAKQRLAPALRPDERRCLFASMVEDVLATLTTSPGLAGVLMVTRSNQAIALAERYGARVLIEEANAGHTEASRFGACTLAAEGALGMLQIPGDLPAITPDDIQAVLDAHGEAPSVTIAPSRDDRGSNAVACSPPDLLPLRFGDDSFFPHVESAKALGIEPTIVRRAGIGLDIDTAEDLNAFLMTTAAGKGSSRTRLYLEKSGIAARLLRSA